MDADTENALVDRLVSQASPGIRATVFSSPTLLGKLSELRDAARERLGPAVLRAHRASILTSARGLLGAQDYALLERLLDEAVASLAAAD